MFYCFGFCCLKIGLVKVTKKQITCGVSSSSVYSRDVNQILANQRLKRLLKEQRLF